MPTRKKKLVEDDEQETQTEETQAEVEETKQKRKPVRRKRVVSTDEVVPPRSIDSIEEPEEVVTLEEVEATAELEEAEIVEEPAEPVSEPVHARTLHHNNEHLAATHFHPRREGMSKAQPVEEGEKISDIRPRVHKPQSDAAFLAPEKFGFELREKHMKRKSQTKWLKGFFYFLGTLIILTAVALFLLSAYSTRLLDNEAENTPATNTEEQNPAAPSSGQYAIVNAEKELSDKLSDMIGDKFGTELTFDASVLPTLPQAEADTLFYRSQAQEQVNTLQVYLNELGIKPQLQINDQMSTDITLYLVNVLAQPDLLGQTTVVYNATETTGLAKKNCDLLTSWKAASCQPLNATTAQTGNTISYKSDKAYFVLKRTNEFKGAKFSKADSAQVEDITVTLGK